MRPGLPGGFGGPAPPVHRVASSPAPAFRSCARRAPTLASIALLSACGVAGGPGCEVVQGPSALPEALAEASGVAASLRHPDTYWVIDDGREPEIHALDGEGTSKGVLRLGIPRARDKEDLALARCDDTWCLYVADTGDNDVARDRVTVYRVREPEDLPPTDPRSPDVFHLRFPDGPRDVEAIFVLPGEDLYLISKGGAAPVSVYRYPGPLRSDSVLTVREIQRLSDGPRVLPRQVTGAGATVDGELVAVRTYETLTVHRLQGDRLEPLLGGSLSLRTLQEPQGEGVGLGSDGRVVLVSEAGPLGSLGSIAVLHCTLGSPGSSR